MSLIGFIEEYKKQKSVIYEETEEEKIIKIENLDNSIYERYKRIYISKKTKLPTKIEILDINENVVVYILYKEIKINKTSQEEVLKD